MQQPAIQSQGTKGACLIIESNDDDQAMMSRVVYRYSSAMHVHVAKTLRAARTMLANGQPTLILLDNNMPDGIGVDFALELAADKRLAQIPVILISDWPSPFMWDKAASAGVRSVVDKNEFGTRYVTEALQTAVHQKQ